MAQVLAMFPGQGSQFVGMGRELLSEFPATRTIFEEAEDAARISIRKLCFDGPEDELKLTANTQPCILTVSVATWHVLQQEAGFAPYAFAGHSLGEYSAVVASGRLSLSRAAFLVRRRGEAMQTAVPAGVGAMAAVLNLSQEELVERCREFSSSGKVLEVVNFNAPGQLVVAGHKVAVEALCKSLEAAGIRSVLLPVSAPFHSSLMQPARDVMTPLLEDSQFVANDSRIIANLTGQLAPDYGSRYLIEQVAAPVLWTQSLATASQAGCDTYVEVGPGKVLFGLARRAVPKTSKLLHTEDLRKTVSDLTALKA
jgi:[acyl-carrier-protein] S-malonyltransferase